MGIYLDNGATTQTRKEVVDAMLPYFTEQYGNPSSLHEYGLQGKKALQEARTQVAELLGCNNHEIYFTSGGTEADNWAIKGYCEAHASVGRHIITTAVEHHAVLHTCRYMEKQGYTVTYLPVDDNGVISLQQLERSIRPDTVLISIMYANNEIGTIMPVREIGAIAGAHGVAFHCDAVQAIGHCDIRPKELGITMLSMSGHKIGGPKGVGFLYVHDGTRMEPLLHGGAQEKQWRAGTENVAGVVGLAKAMECAYASREASEAHLQKLAEYLRNRVLQEIPCARINGVNRFAVDADARLRGNLSFSFAYVEASSLLVFLDMEGIHCSGGSACTSASSKPSHVLEAIGLPDGLVKGTIRVTLSADNTMQEMDMVAEALKRNVAKLRDMNPEYKRRNRGFCGWSK